MFSKPINSLTSPTSQLSQNQGNGNFNGGFDSVKSNNRISKYVARPTPRRNLSPLKKDEVKIDVKPSVFKKRKATLGSTVH